MENERIEAMAQEAIELHTDPRSHLMFRHSIDKSVIQVVNEQDAPDCDSLGDVVAYQEQLISEVSQVVEKFTR